MNDEAIDGDVVEDPDKDPNEGDPEEHSGNGANVSDI